VQFAVVVAYFHRFEAPEAQRKNFITTEDLQEAARLAVWPRKKQPSVTLNNAIKQGYLDRGERGTYRLNAVGENLVAMALPGAANEAPPRPARVLRKPRAPARAAAGRGTRRGKARKAT
jgi:collagenase-like PrtC family protease